MMIPHIESELCWDHGCPEHRPPGYMKKVGSHWASTIPKLIRHLDWCAVPVVISDRFPSMAGQMLPCGKRHPCPRHSGPRLHRYPPASRWDQDWGWAVS